MKILYICTHNRCRSILSEAITNHIAKGKLTAFSAGSEPAGEVHPLTLHYLREKNIPAHNLKSQSWNEFEASRPDLVITVCDNAASEPCPVWFDNSISIHWGLADPSKLDGDQHTIREAFYDVMDTIEKRIRKLMTLNLQDQSRPEQIAQLATLTEI